MQITKHLVKNADYGLIDLGWSMTLGISNGLPGHNDVAGLPATL